MKDKFGSGFSIDFKTIDYAKTFGFECSVAVYLLGLTLGYDKTYDAYYDFVKLPIFELRTENQEANIFTPPTSTHEIKGMETISLQMGWSADNQPQKNVYR